MTKTLWAITHKTDRPDSKTGVEFWRHWADQQRPELVQQITPGCLYVRQGNARRTLRDILSKNANRNTEQNWQIIPVHLTWEEPK